MFIRPKPAAQFGNLFCIHGVLLNGVFFIVSQTGEKFNW
jgi:hypothetical protein